MSAETSRMTAGRDTGAPPGQTRVPPDDAFDARAQILDAAAALFAERGYVATSTGAVAERVGVDEASLHQHFADKDELLLELLETSVRPHLAFAEDLRRHPDRAAALYALASLDVATLLETPHNVATLYLAPEVLTPRFDAFREAIHRRRAVYTRLVALLDPLADADFLGPACVQLVDMAIVLRREREPDPSVAAAIARMCLRVVGLAPSTVARAADAGERLLASLDAAGRF